MTNMTSPKWTAGQFSWPLSLASSTVVGSLLLACVFPFASFAALAALTMTPRRGLVLVTAAWALNQATGFFLMSFPWEAQAVGHGIAILAATLAATVVARAVIEVVRGPVALRAGAALLSAFCVHQLLLRAYASVGGGAENFSAEIVAGVAVNDVIWFTGLLALRMIMVRFSGEKALPVAA
ncbi:MAG: hypothetical protein IBJ12_05110 [Sphingomonadaceae bacterium]|nr:hypothetical protein [Sphingomonadaceae bacterium]